MKNSLWLLVTILILVSLLACESPERENCAEDHDPEYTHTVRLCTDKDTYDFGEPVHITCTVTNVSDETIVFDGGEEPALDIQYGEAKWSDGQEPSSDLTVVKLAPGETRTLIWVWSVSEAQLEPIRNAHYDPFGKLKISPKAVIMPLPHVIVVRGYLLP